MSGRDFSRRAAGGCRLASDDDTMAYAPEGAVFYLILFARGLRDIIRFAREFGGAPLTEMPKKVNLHRQKGKATKFAKDFLSKMSKLRY